MRTFFRLVLSFVIVGLVVSAALFWFALADEPLVTSPRSLTHEDIAQAKQVIRGNDPRRLPADSRGNVTLTRADLNLVSSYLIKRIGTADARVRLSHDLVTLLVTRPWRRLPTRRYLNIELGLATLDGAPRVAGLRVGQIAIPLPLARFGLRVLVAMLPAEEQIDQLAKAVEQVDVSPNALRVRYRWSPQLIDNARSTLLTESDRATLRFYHDLILQLQQQGIGRQGSLTTLLTPLFSAAVVRSRERDPVVENRALLSVLGSWSGRRGLKRLVPGEIARPSRFRLKLRGRTDFAQHFLVSAALAARGDSALSNAVGLFKEIVDAEQGSGFSFTDIAADLAGSRFGELAVTTAPSAARLQHRAAIGLNEPDIMPRVSDLPEFMDGSEFARRFERVGSPAYRSMISKIEARIARLPLYRFD